MLTISILGRPNVGKSTLFNRLTSKRAAIVDDTPGTTRDRREGRGNIGPLIFTVIDTAGLEQKAETGTLQALMMRQTETAIDDADLLLMVVDGRDGIIPADQHFSRQIRKSGKPVILVVNKCESKASESGALEAYKLGLGEPVAISAAHGQGMADLYEAIETLVKEYALDAEADDEIPSGELLHIAIAGRPNVGKSTFFNKLIGEERSIASAVAGTTRDAVYVDWEYAGKPVRLVDTAGLRKRAKRTGGVLEEKSVEDSYKAIRYANVVILMVDAADPLNKVDLALASHVLEEGRGLVIAVNKWDTVAEKKFAKAEIANILEYSLAQGRGVPVVMLSALKGSNVEKVMKEAFTILDRWNFRVGTGKLNRWLEDAQERNNPPLSKGKRIRLKYVTQTKSRPPTFVLFSSSHIADLPESYMRYLQGSLRDEFDLMGVPIRMMLRKADNPFDKKE